jgi:nicotinamide-nucleotide amidase
MSDAQIAALATRVLDAGRARGLKIATAESCTGGLVAGALTDIAGSSDVVERGFVTYSNEAKLEMLGVPAEKPVGLVHVAAAARDGRHAHQECRFGAIGRAEVRRRSVLVALEMLEELATK